MGAFTDESANLLAVWNAFSAGLIWLWGDDPFWTNARESITSREHVNVHSFPERLTIWALMECLKSFRIIALFFWPCWDLTVFKQEFTETPLLTHNSPKYLDPNLA